MMTLNEFLRSAPELFTNAKATAELREKLSASDSRIVELEKSLSEAGLENLSALETARNEKAAVERNLAEISEKAAALEADLKAANDRLADPKSEASRKALEIAAAQGAKPIAAEQKPEGAKEMKRAEFSKMSPGAQMKFVQNGGRLTE